MRLFRSLGVLYLEYPLLILVCMQATGAGIVFFLRAKDFYDFLRVALCGDMPGGQPHNRVAKIDSATKASTLDFCDKVVAELLITLTEKSSPTNPIHPSTE